MKLKEGTIIRIKKEGVNDAFYKIVGTEKNEDRNPPWTDYILEKRNGFSLNIRTSDLHRDLDNKEWASIDNKQGNFPPPE